MTDLPSALGGLEISSDDGKTRFSLRSARTRSYTPASESSKPLGERWHRFDTFALSASAATDSDASQASLRDLGDTASVDLRFRRLSTNVFNADPQAWIWGGVAKVGHAQFDYFDPTTLAAQSDRRSPWSVAGFVAYAPADGTTVFTFSGEHQQAYSAAATASACLPAPSTTCVNGPIGAPKSTPKDLVSFDARKDLGWVAFSATVTYDFRSEVTGVDVPIYLFRKDGDSLNSGVRFSWRDDTGDVTVGLFVGKTLSFLNFSD